MNLFRIVMTTFLSILLLAACMNNGGEESLKPSGENQDLELMKLSSTGMNDQQASNQAKEILSEYEEITAVRAVNAGEHLLIAIEVEHFERFDLDNIERDLRKKVKRNFRDMKVTLSTDQKILLELEELENEIENRTMNHEQLKKRVKKLVDLSKEQT